MSESKPESVSSAAVPSLYLDYGADRHDCDDQEFEVCERGMRFSSRWRFEMGAQLAVAFSYQDQAGKSQNVSTEAIIVECEQLAGKCYQTTLLFLELPDALRTAIRDVDRRLEVNFGNQKKLRPPLSKVGLS